MDQPKTEPMDDCRLDQIEGWLAADPHASGVILCNGLGEAIFAADLRALVARVRAADPYRLACRKIQQWIGCEDQEVDEAVVRRVEGDARRLAEMEAELESINTVLGDIDHELCCNKVTRIDRIKREKSALEAREAALVVATWRHPPDLPQINVDVIAKLPSGNVVVARYCGLAGDDDQPWWESRYGVRVEVEAWVPWPEEAADAWSKRAEVKHD